MRFYLSDKITKQCLFDIGSTMGYDSMGIPTNMESRHDGFCVTIESGGLRLGYNSDPNVTDSYMPTLQAITEGYWYELVVERVGSGASFYLIQDGGGYSYIGPTNAILWTNSDMTSGQATVGNFNPVIGPGNYPFLGKIGRYIYEIFD